MRIRIRGFKYVTQIPRSHSSLKVNGDGSSLPESHTLDYRRYNFILLHIFYSILHIRLYLLYFLNCVSMNRDQLISRLNDFIEI